MTGTPETPRPSPLSSEVAAPASGHAALHDQTIAGIDGLKLTGRPLVVCDVDEVVLHFLKPLEAWLDTRGLFLHAVSYGLTGNIKRKGGYDAVPKDEVHDLLLAFFDDEVGRQDAVEGAGAALLALADTVDVVLLTNLPHHHRERRMENLAGHGLGFPVITNDGPKGPALARLSALTSGPVVFVDDSPSNLKSVLATVPDVHVIQFVADARFLALSPDVPGVRLRTNRWNEVEAYVRGLAPQAESNLE